MLLGLFAEGHEPVGAEVAVQSHRVGAVRAGQVGGRIRLRGRADVVAFGIADDQQALLASFLGQLVIQFHPGRAQRLEVRALGLDRRHVRGHRPKHFATEPAHRFDSLGLGVGPAAQGRGEAVPSRIQADADGGALCADGLAEAVSEMVRMIHVGSSGKGFMLRASYSPGQAG